MGNLFPPDFWGYVYEFSNQPEGLIIPFAYYDPLKAQNLEIMLTTIILFVTSVSVPEQDSIRKGQMYERYKIYKNAAIYKNKVQLGFEFHLHCHDSQ